METEDVVHEQEVEDNDLLDYAFDDYNHQNSNNLNILDQDKPPVFPQQKALAVNIYRRIAYILKTENVSFDNFDKVDFQVTDISSFKFENSFHRIRIVHSSSAASEKVSGLRRYYF